MKKYIVLIMMLLMMFTMPMLAGCSETGEDVSPEEPTQEEIQEYISKSKIEYLDVISKHKKAIDDYTWQSINKGTFTQNLKPIVIRDINGDDVPELLFFMKDDKNKPIAHMYIYTYDENGLVPMEYDFNGGKLSDNADGSGDSYVVYMGSDSRLYIYKSHGDDKFTSTIASYVFSGSSLSCEYTIVKTDTIVLGENNLFMGLDTTYEKDGEVYDSSKAEKEVNAAIANMKSVLISSSYDGTDIFKKFSQEDMECISYEDFVKEFSK